MKPKNNMSFHKMLNKAMKKVEAIPKEHFIEERKKTHKLINQRNIAKYNIDYEQELLRPDLSPYQRQKYRELQNLKETNSFPELIEIE